MQALSSKFILLFYFQVYEQVPDIFSVSVGGRIRPAGGSEALVVQ